MPVDTRHQRLIHKPNRETSEYRSATAAKARRPIECINHFRPTFAQRSERCAISVETDRYTPSFVLRPACKWRMWKLGATGNFVPKTRCIRRCRGKRTCELHRLPHLNVVRIDAEIGWPFRNFILDVVGHVLFATVLHPPSLFLCSFFLHLLLPL